MTVETSIFGLASARNAVTQLIVADDDELTRRGLVQLFDTQADFEVVGQATSVAQTRARTLMLRPVVVILDVSLAGESAFPLCRDLRSSMATPPAFLVLTARHDDETVLAAIEAGAAGYLLKQSSGAEIVEAVRQVSDGGSVLDRRVVGSVMARVRQGVQSIESRYESLTHQERRILDLIAEGLTNRQIGATLFVTEKTVKNNVSAILRKLGLDRRTQAAVYAVRR